ncbi:hypothetical protein [Draconibacterium orientale]|uniref:hypothetical protein n=1 Tax=Draconibacterium orientale TaxID=1168034 RepID=UPI002ABE94C8|nr:hypothetical protein [Draconibacterium orientale]
MKIREGNSDSDTQYGEALRNKNYEVDLSKEDKLNSQVGNRFFGYNEPENDKRLRLNSKYSFVVPWQMPD